MAKFQHTTRADFKTQFFNRIGDSSKTFWTDSEVDLILSEALYTLGAIGQTWRSPIEIKTALNQVFYDISLAPNVALTGYNLTYQYLLDLINFHLIETISTVTPTSEITTLNEILKFARNRVNEYQFRTGLILSKKNFDFGTPNNNQIIIDDEIIDLIRVSYVEYNELFNPYLIHNLGKEDEDSIGHMDRDFANKVVNVPLYYTSVLGNLNSIFVYPLPANLGALEIISVNGIPSSTVLDLTSKIGIPDNLVPYIKWGILADIYGKDGIGYNPAMVSYCEERWREGILIGNNYTSIMEAKLNGLPILLDSISSLDNSQNGWQNNIAMPSLLAVVGYNLIATNCMPNDIYSILMTAITNAYIPTDDADFIDVKLEYIEQLLNYCVHLASIKDGFEAVKMTSNEKDEFIQQAVKHNIRLMKRGINFETMMKKTKRQEEDSSVRVEEAA